VVVVDAGSVEYGITAATSFRGDWGEAISNKILTGPLLTDASGTAIGNGAIVNFGDAIAIGTGADANHWGTAVGPYWYASAVASTCGVAVGGAANGTYYGTALGQLANGIDYGVAIGNSATGQHYAVSVGYNSFAASNAVAIGNCVTNDVPNSTCVKGDLNMRNNDITNCKVASVASLRLGANAAVSNWPTATNSGVKAGNTGTTVIAVGAWTPLLFPTVSKLSIGSFDGTNWTPGAVGWVEIYVKGTISGNHTGKMQTDVVKNGSPYENIKQEYWTETVDGSIAWDRSYLDFSSAVTDVYAVQVFQRLGAPITNNANTLYFIGTVNP
jgi:hypothetical protein